MTTSKPSPIIYLKPHEYLQAYYQYRKNIDPEFSYSAWAAEIGMDDDSDLLLIVYGKRKISENLCKLMVENMKFTYLEQEYFLLLVSYVNSEDVTLKKVLEERIFEVMRRKND